MGGRVRGGVARIGRPRCLHHVGVQPREPEGGHLTPRDVPGLTRRRLLAGAVGAAGAAGARATGLLGAAEAMAGRPAASRIAAVDEPRLLTLDLGTVAAGSQPTVHVPARADLVAVQWSAPRGRRTPAGRVALRVHDARGWSPWADASARGHDATAAEASADPRERFGEPIWTGGGDTVQLRASETLRGIRLHVVDAGPPRGGAQEAGLAALTLATPVLDAGPGQPPIIARDAWAHGLPASGPTLYGAVRLAFVHHTESPNGYGAAEVPPMLRSIYVFHKDVRGWKDFGYNFAIDHFGRVWEGRRGGIDEPLAGAQAGGYNEVSTGVALLGTFGAIDISGPAQRALAHLLAWKLSLHGVPVRGRTTVTVDPAGAVYSRFPAGTRVSLPRVAGHRDADSTDCPGDALYHRLGSLRRRASVLAGRPVRATLASAAGPAAVVVAPGPIALEGALAFLDGAPLAGAAVVLQARGDPAAPASQRERTLAEATTDGAGRFTAQVPAGYNASLRALYMGGAGTPAAVSEPLDVTVAAGITLQAADAHPPAGAPAELTGTVTPPKPRVRLRVAAVAADGTTSRLTEVALDGNSGSFATTVALPGPGRYRFQADTPTDARNDAGSSVPVDVISGS